MNVIPEWSPRNLLFGIQFDRTARCIGCNKIHLFTLSLGLGPAIVTVKVERD